MDKQNNNNPSVTCGDSSLYTKEPMNGFGADVSGSYAYIAAQRKEAEHKKTEKLIDDMKDDFPALSRLYALVKENAV